MESFVHETQAQKVVFGPGSLERLPELVDTLELKRVLVLSTPEQRGLGERVQSLLGARAVGLFSGAVMHVPVNVVDQALALAHERQADACVAVGGGSTLGLGKGMALRSSLPLVAVPTTYAGSEMTPLYGLSQNGEKQTGRDWRVLPVSVLYDPELTRSLPHGMTMASALNAMAHAAEALYGSNASPVHQLMAQEGLRAMGQALAGLERDLGDAQARSDALYGAWLCGGVLGQVQMGLHHKLCHSLGGWFNLPHAELHALLLPYSLAYNSAAIEPSLVRMRQALNCDDVPAYFYELGRRLGLPGSLAQLGMRDLDAPALAEKLMAAPYPNPRTLETEALVALLEDAFAGRRPSQAVAVTSC